MGKVEEQITCFLSGLRNAGPDKKIRPVKTGLIAALLFSFLLSSVNTYAADDRNYGNDYFSPEKILSFTEYLVEKGEYFRAWTELRRLESYYPGYISGEKFDVTALYLMYKGRMYDEVAGYDSAGETGCAAGVIITDSLILLGDYGAALSLVENREAACADNMFTEIYGRRRAYISVVTGKFYADEKKTLKPELSAYRELVEYSIRMHEGAKSPALAALLGLVPGCGYIYAGDEGTGFVAMTVVAVFGAVTYGSYDNGIEPLAILAGAVTLFFYGGNIAGGYLEAKKYNETIDKVIEKKARNIMALDGDVESIYIRFGISSNGK